MKNPTMKNSDRNISRIANPNFKTEEQRRNTVEEEIRRMVFGD